MYLGVEENFWYPLMTLLTASKKSFSEMDFLRARIANMPASVHTDRSSAPVVLGHSLATSSYRMSLSTFIDLEWMLRMCARPSRSGRPNSTCVFGEGESETGQRKSAPRRRRRHQGVRCTRRVSRSTQTRVQEPEESTYSSDANT